MRRLPAMSGAVAAVLLLARSTVASPEPLHPHQIRQNLFAACLPTDRVGWVVGELGRIFRTANGGATWTRQDAGVKKPLLTISCLDTEIAWIGGKSGALFRTTDGGSTWEALTAGTSKHIFDITFTSRTHGVAVGDWGLVMYTDDGGLNWTLVGMPEDFGLSAPAEDIGLDPEEMILYALSFPDAVHGWTVGEFGTILATADGGRTWRQQRPPVDSTLFGTHFVDAARGWAVGIDAVILHTTDGGITWRRVEAPLRQRSLYDIALSGPSGWIAGDAGTLLKSRDGGQTWLVEPLPIELAASWFRAVHVVPAGRGLVVGGEGLLFGIENGRVHDLRAGRSRRATPRGPS